MKGVLIVRQIMAKNGNWRKVWNTRKKVVKKEILPHLNQSDGQDFCVLWSLSAYKLCFRDSACRTSSLTSSAIYTSISIDLLFAISFRNSAYWTFAFASTTAYTFITNYVCHCMYPPFLDYDRFFPFRYPHFNTRWGNIQEFLMYLFE